MDHDTVTSFVQDTITELEQRNALDAVEYLRMMLECDGPDVDGAVSSLVKYGAVTVAWVERLAAINEKSAGFFDEELEHTDKTPGFQRKPGVGVEMGGIEPPSNSRPRILLRAQSTTLFLSPQRPRRLTAR